MKRLFLLSALVLTLATPDALASSVVTAPVATSWLTSATATIAASPVLADLSTFVGAPGLDSFRDEVYSTMRSYRSDFMQWGTTFYVLFFVLQFLLLGITMVVKGPFAIATHRPIHALNPFANFFFFLLAGTLGFMIVSNSVTVEPDGTESGWVPWVYDWFSETGEMTGCDETYLYIADPCDEETVAWIGTQMSGVLTLVASKSGQSKDNKDDWFISQKGAMTSVFASTTVLAIQMVLVKIAFIIAIVSAPLFLSTIVFKPFSGIANGYISFIAYLGVKLMVLQLIAGLLGHVAHQWLTTLIGTVIVGLLASKVTSGSLSIGDMFSFNMSILIMSMLFLSLTLYLPTKLAGMVSQRLNIDLNGILFRGEFPVAIN